MTLDWCSSNPPSLRWSHTTVCLAWSPPHFSSATSFCCQSCTNTIIFKSSIFLLKLACKQLAGMGNTPIYTEPLISAELSQKCFGILAFKLLPSVLTGGAFVLSSLAKCASKAWLPLPCLLEYPYAHIFVPWIPLWMFLQVSKHFYSCLVFWYLLLKV